MDNGRPKVSGKIVGNSEYRVRQHKIMLSGFCIGYTVHIGPDPVFYIVMFVRSELLKGSSLTHVLHVYELTSSSNSDAPIGYHISQRQYSNPDGLRPMRRDEGVKKRNKKNVEAKEWMA